MLNLLIKELRRSFRKSNAASDPQVGSNVNEEVQTEARRAAFRSSDRAGREAMLLSLEAELESRPNDLALSCLVGDWRLDLGRPDAAEAAFRGALAIQPLHSRSLEGLGLALLGQRRFDEAYLRFDAAHRQDPMNSEVLTHWGLVDLDLGNLGKAADKFHKALERNPRNPQAAMNLAVTLLKQGQDEQAIGWLRKALSFKPDLAAAHANLAQALLRQEQLDEALNSAQTAVDLRPQVPRHWVILADTLLALDRVESARQAVVQALELAPDLAAVQIVKAKLASATGATGEARMAYEAALRVEPANPNALLGLGETLLLEGQQSPGWELYEARRNLQPSPVRRLPFPEWAGPQRVDQRLLVHAEQGLGDVILFTGCLPGLIRLGGSGVLEVPPRLHRLMERSFPEMRVVAHDGASSDDLRWLSQLDGEGIQAQLPIGSLPWKFAATAEGLGSRRRYLVPDETAVDEWRARLKRDSGRRAGEPETAGPVVGIAWRGGTAGTRARQRSIGLAAAITALHQPGQRWVGLQYGDVAEDLRSCAAATGVDVLEGLPGYADLDDLAALACACDVVVTVCSTMAHLCGALGLPALLLVPKNNNWRYGLDGASSPWYPSLRLARQQRESDWEVPLAQVRAWLDAWPQGFEAVPTARS